MFVVDLSLVDPFGAKTRLAVTEKEFDWSLSSVRSHATWKKVPIFIRPDFTPDLTINWCSSAHFHLMLSSVPNGFCKLPPYKSIHPSARSPGASVRSGSFYKVVEFSLLHYKTAQRIVSNSTCRRPCTGLAFETPIILSYIVAKWGLCCYKVFLFVNSAFCVLLHTSKTDTSGTRNAAITRSRN